jgi:hypothetical protein
MTPGGLAVERSETLSRQSLRNTSDEFRNEAVETMTPARLAVERSETLSE